MNHVQSLYQLASRQHQHQHGEDGPEEDGAGGQVVQEVVEQHPFSGSALFGIEEYRFHAVD